MPHMLKQVLSGILTPEETAQVYSAFDQIGDIVIIKIPDNLMLKRDLIAHTILEKIKSTKSVFAQVSAVRGEFRVRDLQFLAGENRTMTEHKEHGCRFKVDVAKAYFSPRLSTERQRIAKLVGDNETVVNMFGGVGTFSVVIARTNKTCKVYSIDSNSSAAELCEENARLNKVENRVVSICGDSAHAIRTRLAGQADRVLMPLPERAKDFVDSAVLALGTSGGIVHYFAHVKAEDKTLCRQAGVADAHDAFANHNHRVLGVRIVREVGPRLYQVVADVGVSR